MPRRTCLYAFGLGDDIEAEAGQLGVVGKLVQRVDHDLGEQVQQACVHRGRLRQRAVLGGTTRHVWAVAVQETPGEYACLLICWIVRDKEDAYGALGNKIDVVLLEPQGRAGRIQQSCGHASLALWNTTPLAQNVPRLQR